MLSSLSSLSLSLSLSPLSLSLSLLSINTCNKQSAESQGELIPWHWDLWESRMSLMVQDWVQTLESNPYWCCSIRQQHKQQQNRQGSAANESCLNSWPLWKNYRTTHFGNQFSPWMCKTTYLHNRTSRTQQNIFCITLLLFYPFNKCQPHPYK